MSNINERDIAYLEGKIKVEIISVDRWYKPYRYTFKYEDGSIAMCHRKDLTKRKKK